MELRPTHNMRAIRECIDEEIAAYMDIEPDGSPEDYVASMLIGYAEMLAFLVMDIDSHVVASLEASEDGIKLAITRECQ